MPELTREEKLKIFEKLPKELRDLMESENTGAFLLYLGGKYNLDDDKISSLSKIVGNIILGIMPLSNLISEIDSKLAIDTNAASQITREINTDLLASVVNFLKSASTPTPTSTPTPQSVMPTVKPQIPNTKYQIPGADQYREPTGLSPLPPPISPIQTPPAVNPSAPLGASKVEPPVVSKVEPPKPISEPEIIDLRKTPPSPRQSFSEGGLSPGLPISAAPIPPRPLTFTKPIEPPKPAPSVPLIEAEPHLPASPRPPVVSPSTPLRTGQFEPPVVNKVEPQYIIRPPGMAPTDLPRDVLDLRKDK